MNIILKRRIKHISSFLLVVLFLFAYGHNEVFASTIFNVNSTADGIDINPGDGICETQNGNGVCSIRAAIQEANTSNGNTINIPSGIYNLTISGQGENLSYTGDLDLRKDMTIVGSGISHTIIQGNFIDRIFDIIYDSNRVTYTNDISGLTVQGGSSGNEGLGGAIRNASGITTTLTNVAVSSSNEYAASNFSGIGGGIYNAGIMTLNNSSVSGNTSYGTSSGGGNGAGIASTGTLYLN